jgi:hypothetical protein
MKERFAIGAKSNVALSIKSGYSFLAFSVYGCRRSLPVMTLGPIRCEGSLAHRPGPELFDIVDSRTSSSGALCFLAFKNGLVRKPVYKPVYLMTCNSTVLVLKVRSSPNFLVQNHLILNSGYRHDAMNSEAGNSLILLCLCEFLAFSPSF